MANQMGKNPPSSMGQLEQVEKLGELAGWKYGHHHMTCEVTGEKYIGHRDSKMSLPTAGRLVAGEDVLVVPPAFTPEQAAAFGAALHDATGSGVTVVTITPQEDGTITIEHHVLSVAVANAVDDFMDLQIEEYDNAQSISEMAGTDITGTKPTAGNIGAPTPEGPGETADTGGDDIGDGAGEGGDASASEPGDDGYAPILDADFEPAADQADAESSDGSGDLGSEGELGVPEHGGVQDPEAGDAGTDGEAMEAGSTGPAEGMEESEGEGVDGATPDPV